MVELDEDDVELLRHMFRVVFQYHDAVPVILWGSVEDGFKLTVCRYKSGGLWERLQEACEAFLDKPRGLFSVSDAEPGFHGAKAVIKQPAYTEHDVRWQEACDAYRAWGGYTPSKRVYTVEGDGNLEFREDIDLLCVTRVLGNCLACCLEIETSAVEVTNISLDAHLGWTVSLEVKEVENDH